MDKKGNGHEHDYDDDEDDENESEERDDFDDGTFKQATAHDSDSSSSITDRPPKRLLEILDPLQHFN